MNRAKTLVALSEWERMWSLKWAGAFKPDREYSLRKKSQYPETAIHMSAGATADADYWAGVALILAGQSPTSMQETPVIKHPGHPDQKVHGGGRGAGVGGAQPFDIISGGSESYAALHDDYDGMSYGQKMAHDNYTADGYREINAEVMTLKEHNDDVFWYAKEYPPGERTDAMDLLVAFDDHAGTFPRDATVYRGEKFASRPTQISEGQRLGPAGFMSTTANFDTAMGFAVGPYSREWSIKAPAGTKFLKGSAREFELILSPETIMTVTKVTTTGTATFIEAEIANG